jgi:hypothetical protein
MGFAVECRVLVGKGVAMEKAGKHSDDWMARSEQKRSEEKARIVLASHGFACTWWGSVYSA